MSNLGCFPVAESLPWDPFCSHQSHNEEGSDGKLYPPPLDKPILRNVLWQSDSGRTASSLSGNDRRQGFNKGSGFSLAHCLAASPDSLGLDPGSAGSTVLPLGPAHSGVGNHVALALHPSSEKLTVPTQVFLSFLHFWLHRASTCPPLEYRCALWPPGVA